MLSSDVKQIKNFSEQLAVTAGKLLLKNSNNRKITKRKGKYDVQLDTDILVENEIIKSIENKYPNHSIYAEESEFSGNITNLDNLWIIDPIEGTNNLSCGIPYYGITITYVRSGKPMVAIIYDPIMNNLYTAVNGDRATLNGNTIKCGSQQIKISDANISLVVNYLEEGREKGYLLNNILGRKCKRVLSLWAPALDLARISSEDIEGMLCWEGMYLDTCSGLLMVSEAGGVLIDLNGNAFNSQLAITEPTSFIAATNHDLAYKILDILNELA